MTLGNRQDHLDDALTMVASRRLASLPKFMAKRLKDVTKTAGDTELLPFWDACVHHISMLRVLLISSCCAAESCRSKIASLQAEAAKQGIADLNAALAKLQTAPSQPEVDLAADPHVRLRFICVILQLSKVLH